MQVQKLTSIQESAIKKDYRILVKAGILNYYLQVIDSNVLFEILFEKFKDEITGKAQAFLDEEEAKKCNV